MITDSDFLDRSETLRQLQENQSWRDLPASTSLSSDMHRRIQGDVQHIVVTNEPVRQIMVKNAAGHVVEYSFVWFFDQVPWQAIKKCHQEILDGASMGTFLRQAGFLFSRVELGDEKLQDPRVASLYLSGDIQKKSVIGLVDDRVYAYIEEYYPYYSAESKQQSVL